MKNNGMRNISSLALFTIAIFVTINIHDSQAKMTIEQIRNTLKPFHKTCVTKTDVSKELVSKTHTGEFPPDPKLQCYFSCLLKMTKVMNKEQKIDINVMIKQIDMMMPEDLANPAKQICQTCFDKITSSEPCEMSWEFTKCYYEMDSSMYIFP